MVWGVAFFQRMRQSSLVGGVIAILFVVVFCILGYAGVALVQGFHLAGG